MKMLRQAVAKAQDANMVLALEARVNELRELTALIPEYQELSQNLSLESVVNHIRGREAGIPQVIEKFSLRTMALENDGLIFAGVIAIIAAITALIMRFTDWLGGGNSSSSSGAGGSGGSSSGNSYKTGYNTRFFTPKADTDYLARAYLRAEAERKRQAASDHLDETLRKLREARYARDKAHASGPSASSNTGKKTGPTIRNIGDVINLWLKDPDNKETSLYKFLKNNDPMYQEISERGGYYQLMHAQQPLNSKIAELISNWPDRLEKTKSIIASATAGNVDAAKLESLEGEMTKLNVGVIVIGLPGKGNVRLDEVGIFMDEAYEKASQRHGDKPISFQKLNEHFFTTEVIKLAGQMANDLDEAATYLKKTQEQLSHLEQTLRTANTSDSSLKPLMVKTNTVMDAARRDVMAYVRYIHHIKRFVNLVKHMDTEMVRANAKVIQILRDIVVDDPEDRGALNAARKALEESMTINS